jgi:hypothetical protein
VILDRHVLPLDIARLLEAFAKRSTQARGVLRRATVDETNHRHHRLLCARRERPNRRVADERDELAPFHVWMAPAWQEKM